MAEMERVAAPLAEIDKVLAKQTLADSRALKLMTIPGIGLVVASVVLASIGDIARFPSPDKLSSYFGLTPRIRQSGDHPARQGRISKQGNADARKMLVEAAWSAKTAPGPLRAFFNRVQKKRGAPAAAVATARKLAVMIWHVLTSGEEYAFARPLFTAMKLLAAIPVERLLRWIATVRTVVQGCSRAQESVCSARALGVSQHHYVGVLEQGRSSLGMPSKMRERCHDFRPAFLRPQNPAHLPAPKDPSSPDRSPATKPST